MSSQEEMESAVSQQKRSFLQMIGSLSVRWKIRIAYITGILVTACLIIIMVHMFQRRESIRSAYEKLNLLRTAKTGLTEAYFESLSGRIRSFSADPQILDWQSRLTESFLNIENENFSTPGAESPDRINELLKGYYLSEVIPSLETRMDTRIPVNSLVSDDHRQQILQYLYIAGNPRPAGSKYLLTRTPDASIYSNLHSQFQPAMINYLREARIADMLLVDYKSGYVVYSVKKNLDFASNLYNGPFKNSSLAMAFKGAISLPSAGSVRITDESIYAPAICRPTLFISAPLYSGNEIKGAVIFAVDASTLDGLLSPDKEDPEVSSGLNSFYLGNDLLYRNNDAGMAAGQDRYVHKLKKFADDRTAYRQTGNLHTTAMIQKVDEVAFANAVSGKEMITEYTTEAGQHVLCSYGPVNIPGLDWLLVSQLDKSRALKPVRNLTWFLTGIALLLIVLMYFMVHVLSGRMTRRFSGLGDFLHALAKGERPPVLPAGNGDEIDVSVRGANLITHRIEQASRFVDNLSKGNIEHEFGSQGPEDSLGQALNNLKQKLVHSREEEESRKKEEEIRNWAAQGVALFNDILRTDNNNLEKLSLNIIRNIIQYLSANQGGMFLINEDEGVKHLDLVAAYAFDRQKFLNRKIRIGEGLVGTCALEKKTILLSKIPENYIEITSGLGGARPGCLLIVPLKKEEEILGVIEIASFSPFQTHEVDFVEKVTESIAAALISVRLHLQTSTFLEKFQQQAEEMKAQDEELRQNIEELQATHEQMEKIKQEENERNERMLKEIDNHRKLLIDILNKVPAKIFLKDENGVFVVVNSSVASIYNKSPEQVIGTTDYDNHPDEDVDSWRAQELEIINKGETTTYVHEEKLQGSSRFLNTTKLPFTLATTGKTGLLGIQFDISDLKLLERKVEELESEIIKLKKG